LNQVFDGNLQAGNPVNLEDMKYKSVGQCVQDEKRYHGSVGLGWFARFAEIIAAVLVFKFKIPPLAFNPKKYFHAMRSHSDYRKFDDMLRMILDCSPSQVIEIEKYLERAKESGELFYGLHESDTALMTCYVNSLDDGKHIHFIDGGSGGYAIAAKQLKAQMREFE
jgi:hypothetical protein